MDTEPPDPIITLDARQWRSILDFYEALLTALEAPFWHGTSINALVDSMIWGGINYVEPPYRVQIINSDAIPGEMRDEILETAGALARARAEYELQNGEDVRVSMEIVS